MPEGYTATSPTDWAVIIPEAESIDIGFGARMAPSPELGTSTPVATATEAALEPTAPTETPTTTEEETPPAGTAGKGPGNYSGLLVALIAVALPLGLRQLRARL